MNASPRDPNHIPALVATSATNPNEVVYVEADPVTKRLKVDTNAPGGGSAQTAFLINQIINVLTDTGILIMGSYLDGADLKAVPLQLDTAGRIIGDVTSNSQDISTETTLNSVLSAVQAATPAGTNLIGKVSAGQDTSVIYNGTTSLTPKFAVVDCATSGNNTIVAAVTSKKIRVHQCLLNVAADVTIRWESAADGTALTGQNQVKAGSGYILPFSPIGWFETTAGQLLNLELSGAVSVDGVIAYTEV